MSKELIANLGVVSRCLSNAGCPKMSLIVEQASETLSHLPDREEVARVIYPEAFEEPTPHTSTVYRCMAYHEARADALERADRILSLMERKA